MLFHENISYLWRQNFRMKIKQFLFLAAITIATVGVHAQQPVASSAQFRRDFTGNIYQQNKGSILNNTSGYNEEKYRRFKKMRTAGIALTSVGAALIAGGTVLIAQGANENEKSNYYWDDDYYYTDLNTSNGKIIAGLLGIVFGAASTGGGITMWIIGNNKMRKYGSGHLSLQPNKSGIGIAYRF